MVATNGGPINTNTYMRYIIACLLLLLSAGLFAQVKPNEFTEEHNPDNSNFETYSQKNGVNRRASLYNLKRYFTAAINVGAIDYVPEETGNSSEDYGEFVVDPNGDTWFIDMTGRSFIIYANSENNGVTDAYLSTDNDTLFIVTATDTVIVPGLSDLDDQGFTITENDTVYTYDLDGTIDDFVFREGPNITMTLYGDTLEIAATPSGEEQGEINVGDNVGAGAELYKEKGDTTLFFRTLVEDGIVNITQGTNDVTISAVELDGDTLNELQVLSYSNDTLYLSDGGGFVVIQATDDQAISLSGDTIFLEGGGYIVLSYLTGSGNDDRIAYWNNDTLTSTIWEISPTYIRGSGTGWPHIENGLYTWRDDTNTGIKRISADVVGLHAGDSTNPAIGADGPGEEVWIDPDDNGTANATFTAVRTTFANTVRLSTQSTANTTHIVGLDASEDMTKVVFGNGFSVNPGATVDTVEYTGSGSNPYYFGYLGDGGVWAESISASPTWDTLDFTLVDAISNDVSYEIPTGSTQKAFTVAVAGVYEIKYTLNAQLSGATSNAEFRVKLIKNNTSEIEDGRFHGCETSDYTDHTAFWLADLQAGDYIHTIMTQTTGSANNLNIQSGQFIVQKISD